MAEERAAWNTERPDKPGVDQDIIAAPDRDSLDTADIEDLKLEQERVHLDQHAPTLKHFGPTSDSGDASDRPKTSRGPSSLTESLPGAFPQDTRVNAQVIRRSKFLEGSMSQRSVAVASTWMEHGSRLSECSERGDAEDSDATPRASRVSRDSGSSFDVSEFRPQATTPSTIRGKLARFVKRSSEDAIEPTQVENKQKKKGLRKSISTWSLHNIGDKVKFFGASTSDLPDNQMSPHKHASNPPLADLNERKRKAEEAYAQQFGTKKQKTNDGIPIPDPKNLRTPAQPRTLKRRFVSEQTITPATATRRPREQPSGSTLTSTLSSLDPAAIMSDSDQDHRKRPSRSELEKENQHLRAMLREQQMQRHGVMHRKASKSSVHLPIDDDIHGSSTRSASRPNASKGDPLKNTKQKQYQHKGIPPVPALPGRDVLTSLGSNGQNAGTHADTGTMKRIKSGFLRPVSMIVEEEIENNDPGVPKEQFPTKSPTPMSPQPLSHAGSRRKEDWEWPDDVF